MSASATKGALMQCQGCRTTTFSARQMTQMSPVRPLTLSALSGKEKQDVRRAPDTCFIQMATERFSDHTPNTAVLQSNKSFLGISRLNCGEEKQRDKRPHVERTEPMKGASRCRW